MGNGITINLSQFLAAFSAFRNFIIQSGIFKVVQLLSVCWGGMGGWEECL